MVRPSNLRGSMHACMQSSRHPAATCMQSDRRPAATHACVEAGRGNNGETGESGSAHSKSSRPGSPPSGSPPSMYKSAGVGTCQHGSNHRVVAVRAENRSQ